MKTANPFSTPLETPDAQASTGPRSVADPPSPENANRQHEARNLRHWTGIGIGIGWLAYHWLCTEYKPAAAAKPAPPPETHEDFEREREARNLFLLILVLVVVAWQVLLLVYEEHGGYWFLYFGEHGTAAEPCLVVLLGAITFWMRAILFPRRVGLPKEAFPETKTYLEALNSAPAPPPAGTVAQPVPLRQAGCAVGILCVVCIVSSVLFVFWPFASLTAAPQPAVAAVLIALLFCILALYPRQRKERETIAPKPAAPISEELKELMGKGVFQSRTRGTKFYWGFWPIAGISLFLYAHFWQSNYRWPVDLRYYAFWFVPFALMTALCWEVLWAVILSYHPKHLKQIQSVGTLDWLHKALYEDTARLIWSVGTLAFFLITFFGDFYIAGSKYIYFPFTALVVGVLLMQWIWASGRAQEIMRPHINRVEKDIAQCYTEMYKPEKERGWEEYQEKLAGLKAENAELQEILAKFDLSRWLQDRRKDLVPITLINAVGPFLTGTFFDLIRGQMK